MLRSILSAFALLLLCAGPASGAGIDLSGSSLNGSTVTDLGGGTGSLSLEIDFELPGTIDLAVTLAPGEGPIAFDLLGFNFLPFDLADVSLLLSGGAVFSTLGDAEDGSGNPALVSGGGSSASVVFTPAEPTLFSLGDALATGSTDWVIDVSGVPAGGFGLALVVPEPSGLGVLATLGALLATVTARTGRRALAQGATRGA